MMKKYLSVLLAAVMILSLLAGCGGKPAETPVNPGPTPETPSPTPSEPTPSVPKEPEAEYGPDGRKVAED